MNHADHVTTLGHFTWPEFLVSKDYPELLGGFFLTDQDKAIIRLGVQSILDPIRESFGVPYILTSAKRSPALNAAVGGSEGSDHLTANAVDGFLKGMSPWTVFVAAMQMDLPFRQLIYYPKAATPFVHISWNIPGKVYKHEAKIAG